MWTADYVGNKLFWVDAKLHMICSSNLDGSQQRVVLMSREHLKHPFSVAVFEVCYYSLSYGICSLCPVWARERYRISPSRFLAESHIRQLNQGRFVLLCFALFAFSGLCLVCVLSVFLICLLSCIFQGEPTWMALYSFSLIVLICCYSPSLFTIQYKHWFILNYTSVTSNNYYYELIIHWPHLSAFSAWRMSIVSSQSCQFSDVLSVRQSADPVKANELPVCGGGWSIAVVI